MKGCDLCGKGGGEVGGMMYCEADSARLCWECDATVHGANFLVAKHTRVLLCHACQAPTPWRASGSALSPALSLCPACHVAKENDDEGDEEEEYSWSGGGDDEGEGENQVVPWSPVNSGPPVASSSSSDDGGGLKRVRRFGDDGGDSDLDDDDDSEGEITSHEEGGGNNPIRPPLRKKPKTLLVDTQPQHHHQPQPPPDLVDQSCGGRNGSRSTADIIKGLQTDVTIDEENHNSHDTRYG